MSKKGTHVPPQNVCRLGAGAVAVVVVCLVTAIWVCLNCTCPTSNGKATQVAVTHPVVETASPFLESPSFNQRGIKQRPLFDVELKAFEATLKSCLGRYCMDETFNTDRSPKTNRLAILSPTLDQTVLQVHSAIQPHFRNADETLLFTRNVPVYGYGRSHGWTRIVRFTDNIVSSAFRDVLSALGHSRFNQSSVVYTENFHAKFSAQIRALMRWHCRLNHVSAHTSMLSVDLRELRRSPASTVQHILSFLNRKNAAPFASQVASILHVDKQDSEEVPEVLWEVARKTIAEEMHQSDGLSKWPCSPFRTLALDLVVQPYKALAPNCSAALKAESPFIKCSVNHDIAEQ